MDSAGGRPARILWRFTLKEIITPTYESYYYDTDKVLDDIIEQRQKEDLEKEISTLQQRIMVLENILKRVRLPQFKFFDKRGKVLNKMEKWEEEGRIRRDLMDKEERMTRLLQKKDFQQYMHMVINEQGKALDEIIKQEQKQKLAVKMSTLQQRKVLMSEQKRMRLQQNMVLKNNQKRMGRVH